MNWRSKLPQLYYGGDYNPEQWPEEVWRDDMRLMKRAGVNLVSIGIFGWALLQPDRDTYDFAWMDRLMDLLAEHGIYADLATATASPPTWMATQYPDMLPMDENGARYTHGSRQHYCPNSAAYRLYSQRLARKLAGRYKGHPALLMWHVNNEYACHVSRCHCPRCAERFREWLERRYRTLDELNDRWGTGFWSQKYYRWEEISTPGKTPTYANPGQQLDYARFMSDSLLECYLGERNALKEITPDVPVMTNFMQSFKPLDYFEWAKHMDVVTWDSYPEPTAGIPFDAAMWHDMMRSLKGGQPFVLMEQTTSQVNWRDRNPLKRPGIMRLWSYQAVARGGDGVMFFQWRASRSGAEKFHGAMVTHSGDANSRIYREVEQLGGELARLGPVVDSRICAKAAILFDWHNWWALELDGKPSRDVRYIEQVGRFHKALYQQNIAVDFIPPDADPGGYSLVIAPALYMIGPGVADRLERYVAAGGTLICSFFSGIVDENDRVHLGGYPAPLRKLLGICVEEFDPMLPGQTNGLRMSGADGEPMEHYSCDLWADLIRLEGAEAIAEFTRDFFAGSPAVTSHAYGKGKAVYIGTQAEERFYSAFLRKHLDDLQLAPPLRAPEGVEVTCRRRDGESYLFVLNHLDAPAVVQLPAGEFRDLIGGGLCSGSLELPPRDVAVLRAGAGESMLPG